MANPAKPTIYRRVALWGPKTASGAKRLAGRKRFEGHGPRNPGGAGESERRGFRRHAPLRLSARTVHGGRRQRSRGKVRGNRPSSFPPPPPPKFGNGCRIPQHVGRPDCKEPFSGFLPGAGNRMVGGQAGRFDSVRGGRPGAIGRFIWEKIGEGGWSSCGQGGIQAGQQGVGAGRAP